MGTGIMYRRLYDSMLKKHSNLIAPQTEDSYKTKEKEWIQLWSKLSKRPHVNSFRLFSKYIGPDINIVPEDICSGIIQPILNPVETRPYYQDKNMFDIILGKNIMPRTLLRSIGGCLQNSDYEYISPDLLDNNTREKSERYLRNLLDDCPTIFIKPAVDSASGHGVRGFKLGSDGRYHEIGGERIFNLDFLNEYKEAYSDFILQEGLAQHPYLSQFNPTSTNTLRIATYRSVKDNQVHVTGIILRIGKNGSCVDNSHAGGVAIGVHMDGTLCKYATDPDGNKYEVFNGINFKDNTFKIPEFDKIIEFAKEVGKKEHHHRLVAQDICLDASGAPMLIEFNIRAFGLWVFQFTSSPALGKFAPEIIDYCAPRLSKINKVIVEPF